MPVDAERIVPSSHVDVQALCNTPDDGLFANIAANSRRMLPWVALHEATTIPAVICGGGPSLAATMPGIIARARAGAHVFAINGAAKFLCEHGVKPGWLIMIDPRPENLCFVCSRPALRYLIASQCHPSLFEELVGDDVTLFHPVIEGIENHLPRGSKYTLIGGGITSGLSAMALAYALGYREMHLFGYDSSDAPDGAAHAYAQAQTPQEVRRLHSRVGGRDFHASFAMFKQAEEFPGIANMLADLDCTITVHGDGLLPTIAREMTRPRDASRAVYDLARCPTSYDFVSWLVQAEMHRQVEAAPGPLKVAFARGPNGGFRNDNLPKTDHQRFLDNVMRPALALIGAVEDSEISDDACRIAIYTLKPVVEMVRAGTAVPRFETSLQALWAIERLLADNGIERRPIVITLREATHWPARNSKLLNWMRFAQFLQSQDEQVVFVRDTERANELLSSFPICAAASRDLMARMALYERAKCNLMLGHGPGALLYFSHAPFLFFQPMQGDDPALAEYGPASEEWFKAHNGIGRGEQYPWLKPDQRIVWDTDSYAAIRKAWDEIVPLLWR